MSGYIPSPYVTDTSRISRTHRTQRWSHILRRIGRMDEGWGHPGAMDEGSGHPGAQLCGRLRLVPLENGSLGVYPLPETEQFRLYDSQYCLQFCSCYISSES